MERARRKDMMDGGVAQQRAKDLLAPIGDAMLGFTDDEDARDFVSQPYGLAKHAGTLAEYLRGAYAEGYAEGIAAEDAAIRERMVLAHAYERLLTYARENGRAKVLGDVLRVLRPRFDAVLKNALDLTYEKREQLLDALFEAVRAAADATAGATDDV